MCYIKIRIKINFHAHIRTLYACDMNKFRMRSKRLGNHTNNTILEKNTMKELSQEKNINSGGTLMSNKACYRKKTYRARGVKHSHFHTANTEAALDTGGIRSAPRLNQQNNPNSKHFNFGKIAHVYIGGLAYTSHPRAFLTHVSPGPESPLPGSQVPFSSIS